MLCVYLLRLSPASISFVCLLRLSRLSRLCYAVRLSRASRLVFLCCASVLCCASISCVCLVYLLRLSRASISLVYLLSALFVSCVCLVRLSRASVSCVYLLRLSPASRLRCCLTPLNSFKHVKRVNSFKRLSPASVSGPRCSYYPLSNSTLSIHSIHSKYPKRSTLITT